MGREEIAIKLSQVLTFSGFVTHKIILTISNSGDIKTVTSSVEKLIDSSIRTSIRISSGLLDWILKYISYFESCGRIARRFHVRNRNDFLFLFSYHAVRWKEVKEAIVIPIKVS